MDAHGPWRVASLKPSRRDDFLAFFDHERGRAFADNPEWAGCYCHFFHVDSQPAWEALDATANRTAMRARIEVGEMEGFLAYDADDRVVGWLNAQPRPKLPHCFAQLRVDPPPIDVASHEAALVLCFVVDPALRRSGMARALLEHALADFVARGIRVVDAFPSRNPIGLFRGPQSLYEAAGFEPIGISGNTVMMRKRLP